MWLRYDTLFIWDGNNWVEIAGGGGGGGTPGSVTIIGGDGIEAVTVGSTVTITADINESRGLDIVGDQIAVKLGAGLEFDGNGRIKVTDAILNGSANDGKTTLTDADGNEIGYWTADQPGDALIPLPDYAVKNTSDIPYCQRRQAAVLGCRWRCSV